MRYVLPIASTELHKTVGVSEFICISRHQITHRKHVLVLFLY